MDRPKYLMQIEDRIANSKEGSVFVPSDFTDITDKKKVSVCLSRLEKTHLIRRILRGVYEKGEYNEFIKEYVVPSPNRVANAIARNYGWTVVPCGDTALNILGLSTQVPAIWLYVSDGIYREYKYDNTIIKFKKTNNKEISKLSYKSAIVVQALKALGKENITESVILKLRKVLKSEEKEIMLKETKIVTSWIYEYIKEICRSDINEKYSKA